jgi:hypothetical protein
VLLILPTETLEVAHDTALMPLKQMPPQSLSASVM